MISVVGCIIQEHDLWLVLVAAIICSAGAWATMQLFNRVLQASSSERAAWLVLTAVVAGASIWCTHFIAMLGYNPGLPVTFDPVLTIVSLLVAIGGVAAGFSIAANGRWKTAAPVGGAVVGLAVAVMHYTGMLAYRVQGIVSWDYGYLVSSVVMAVVFCGAAITVSRHAWFVRSRYMASGLFVLGIVTLHFTGMTAFKVDLMQVDSSFSNPGALRAMAIAVAAVAAVILCAGWASNFIDTRARAEASDALNNMSNGLIMIASDGTIQLFNRRLLELFRLDDTEVTIGGSLKTYLAAISRKVGWDEKRLQRIVENHEIWMSGHETVRLDHHFDDGMVLNIACQPVKNGGAIITYDDVTEARKSEAKVTHMAFHDALTGLPNRRRFAERLSTLAGNQDFALLMVDLDRFKFVNDTLGHAVGDILLVAVAQRLRKVCGSADTAFRLGGDELGVLLTTDVDTTIALAQDIVHALSQPYEIGNETASIGCSVGVAFADSRADAQMIQKMADLALYKAKDNGRGRVEVYIQGMMEHAVARRELERDLGNALGLQQFELHYQPLYDLPGRTLSGFEALIRWRHPVRGLIPPSDFISVAEHTGAILDIGAWVIDEACRQLSKWPAHIYMSINVSPVQLRSSDILQQITGALNRHGLLPRRVEIELTETAMVDKNEQVAAALSGLRTLGVRIAMDDFGTGYSSLAHLREFELDRIKIDRSFISGSANDSSAAAVVRAVTGMARDLSIATTGEGVENEEQLASLVALGCGTAQGYLLGRPLTAADADRLFDGSSAIGLQTDRHRGAA